MKANELRLGNWVQLDEGQYFKVTAITDRVGDFEDFQPIPLTAEILEKAGFNDFYTISIFDAYQNEVIICYDNQEKVFAIGGNWYNAEYLHQIQNIIHSLTGEELNIEL